MYASLNLCACRPEFESYPTPFNAILQLCDAFDPDILEGVLHPSMQVRQEGLDTALVLDVARYTLCDFDSRGLGEVPSRCGILMWR